MADEETRTGRDPDAASSELKRSLGIVAVAALGVGAMVGAGVFVLTGIAAGEAGPSLLLAFLLNGVIALIIGGCYAELATMIPKTGGAYVWARPALGKKWGFFGGWCSWFAQLVACAFYAAAFGSFAAELVAELGIGAGLDPTLMSSLVLLLFLSINIASTENSSLAQMLMAGLQVAIIAVFIGFGISAMADQPSPAASFTPFFAEGPLGLLAAMGLTFIAFEGFEIIVQSSEEAREPDKAIPRAIAISIALVVLIYVLTAGVLLGTVEPPSNMTAHGYLASLGELGLVKTAGEILPYGTVVLLIAALASTASALNATIYGSTRIALAMARNSDLPSKLSRVSGRGAPVPALMLNGGIMLAAVLVLPIKDIASSADIMFILVFVLVAISLLRLRRKMPDRERPFRLPMVPYLPWFVVLCGGALALSLYHVSVAAWIVAGSWLILGVLLRTILHRSD